jgi:hypothetical protein
VDAAWLDDGERSSMRTEFVAEMDRLEVALGEA